jgi:hypothetical protein
MRALRTLGGPCAAALLGTWLVACAQTEPPSDEVMPPAPAVSAAELIGISAEDLDRKLGQPSLLRRESPAEVWQYRNGTCVLDLFVYEEAGRRRVVHLEARDSGARPMPSDECLAALFSGESAS